MSVATATLGTRPVTLRRSASPLLVAGLVLATGWAVLAGGWTDGTPGVLLVGLAGAAEGYLVARWRTPRTAALAMAPFLLFLSLLPTNAASRPVSAGTGLGHLIGQYATAAASGLLGNAPWEFNVGLGALLWVCGAWAAWFAVRERRGAIATGPCWAVVAVDIINAPSAAAITLPATLASAVALLLIAAVHLDRLNDSWQRRRVSVLPGTSGRFAAASLVGGVLVVVLALVIPPLSSSDISGRLFGGGNNGGTARGGHSNGGAHGTGGNSVRFSSATVPGGALSLSDSPVMSYTSSLQTGVYLRMETDSVFDAGNFLPAQSANNNGDDTQEILEKPGLIARDRVVADGGVGLLQAPVALSVRMIDDTSNTNTLPFAGEPDITGVPSRVNGLSTPEVNGLLTVDSVEGLREVIGTSFTTTATASTASVDQLRHAGSAYPSLITRDFLDLTDDATHGAATIRALALQWTRTATNPYDKASLIESTLRNPQLFHYTLSPPTPPPITQAWAVTYFLSRTHSGYCQYFAVAMGSMLRALGIPSRLINGYGPGTAPNAASRRTDSENSWNVSSNDAHTWVEAYFPHYGWIPFEPTPPSQAGDYQPFGRGSLAATGPAGGKATPAATPSSAPSRSSAQAAVGAAAGSSGGRTALLGAAGIGLAVLAVLGLFAGWFLRPRNVAGVWRRVGIMGRLLGVRRDRAQTFDEYVDRLAAALPSAPPTAWQSRLAGGLREIAALSDRAFYSAAPAHGDAGMKRAWRRVALLTPRLSRRPMPAQPPA